MVPGIFEYGFVEPVGVADRHALGRVRRERPADDRQGPIVRVSIRRARAPARERGRERRTGRVGAGRTGVRDERERRDRRDRYGRHHERDGCCSTPVERHPDPVPPPGRECAATDLPVQKRIDGVGSIFQSAGDRRLVGVESPADQRERGQGPVFGSAGVQPALLEHELPNADGSGRGRRSSAGEERSGALAVRSRPDPKQGQVWNEPVLLGSSERAQRDPRVPRERPERIGPIGGTDPDHAWAFPGRERTDPLETEIERRVGVGYRSQRSLDAGDDRGVDLAEKPEGQVIRRRVSRTPVGRYLDRHEGAHRTGRWSCLIPVRWARWVRAAHERR